MIEIVAAERGVAGGCQYFEDAAREAQDRQVEGATSEVVDGVGTLGAVVEAVRDRGRGRLVEQAQHIQSCDARRILGRLPLRVVEVRRHGHDRALQFAAETLLGANAQRAQDFGRDLDWRLDSRARLDLHHALAVDEAIRKAARVGKIVQAATHEPLDRHDAVLRVVCLRQFGLVADFDAGRGIADD